MDHQLMLFEQFMVFPFPIGETFPGGGGFFGRFIYIYYIYSQNHQIYSNYIKNIIKIFILSGVFWPLYAINKHIPKISFKCIFTNISCSNVFPPKHTFERTINDSVSDKVSDSLTQRLSSLLERLVTLKIMVKYISGQNLFTLYIIII